MKRLFVLCVTALLAVGTTSAQDMRSDLIKVRSVIFRYERQLNMDFELVIPSEVDTTLQEFSLLIEKSDEPDLGAIRLSFEGAGLASGETHHLITVVPPPGDDLQYRLWQKIANPAKEDGYYKSAAVTVTVTLPPEEASPAIQPTPAVVGRNDLSLKAITIIDFAGIELPVDLSALEGPGGELAGAQNAEIWDLDPECAAETFAKMLPDPAGMTFDSEDERAAANQKFNEYRLADYALRKAARDQFGIFAPDAVNLASLVHDGRDDPLVGWLDSLDMARPLICARVSQNHSHVHSHLWHFMRFTSDRLGVDASDPEQFIDILTRSTIAGKEGMKTIAGRLDHACTGRWAKDIAALDAPLPAATLLAARVEELYARKDRSPEEEAEYQAIWSYMTLYRDKWLRNDSAVAEHERLRSQAAGHLKGCITG